MKGIGVARRRCRFALRTEAAYWRRLLLYRWRARRRDLLRVDVVIGLAFHLGLCHPMQGLIQAVDPQVTALQVFYEDDCGGVVEDGAQLSLVIAERVFDPPALGHVALYCDEMRHGAALVMHRPDAPFEAKLRAILTVIDRLSVEDFSRLAVLTETGENGAVGLRALQDAGRLADQFFGRIAGHLRESRVDVNNLWSRPVESRRRDDDRLVTLPHRRFEQSQLLFSLIIKVALRARDDRATRAGAGPGDLPSFISMLAPDGLGLQNSEVCFKREVLLDQFMLTRRGLSPLFGFFYCLAHGAAQFRPSGAALFKAVMRATLHRLDCELRVARADQRDHGASRPPFFGGEFLERIQSG